MSKFNFKFSNLCGSSYQQGNLVFTADGNSVLSPVGNRITVFDLVNHQSTTLPFENLKNISRLALAPNGMALLSVDEDGHALFINLLKKIVLAEFHFRQQVLDLKFSPDSKYFAVTNGRMVRVWRTPPLISEYRPFVLHREYTGHYDDVRCIEWSPDSQFFVTGSKDMTARIYSLDTIAGFQPLTMSGHHSHVVGCFFGAGDEDSKDPRPRLYTISKDGSFFIWDFEPFVVPESLPGASDTKTAPSQQNANSSTSNSNAGPAKPRQKKAGEQEDEEDEDHEIDEDAESDSDADEKSKSGASKSGSGSNPPPEKKAKTHAIHQRRKEKHELLKKRLQTEASSIPLLARGRFKLRERKYVEHNGAKIACCAIHRAKGADMVVIGLTSGIFSLYELPDFNCIHTLSIGQHRISTVTINASGEWLAFGSSRLGQLVVWEWQSESHVLKQQGHFFDVNTLAFSPDGQLLATGGDDGKVKLWNTTTGFCFVTFSSHTAPVNHVEFSSSGTVVFSSSLDGTVRAHDLVRYRQFRTLTSPQPVQFTSLSVDPSGEIVCAGSMDPFEIYVWEVKTGKLLDVLSGHEAPISGLSFSSAQSLLASSSWDKTVRLWDPFTGKSQIEAFSHSSDVLALAFRPDGKELVSSALDGHLYFWDTANGNLKMEIEDKKDIMGGRRVDDVRTAKNSTHSTAFTSLCYSADGTCVLAGGNSKYVCIYEISQKILLKKFVISHNRSLDGIHNILDARRMTDAGVNRDLLDADDSGDDHDTGESKAALPGAKRGDFSSCRTRLAARTKCVRFSPTGMQWAAASTEGLLIYSLDDSLTFDPSDLGIDITPQNTEVALKQKQFGKSLLMALSLNDQKLIEKVLEATPSSEVPLVARSIPLHRLQRLLAVVSQNIERSPHLEFYMLWAQTLLTVHGSFLKKNSNRMLTAFRGLQKTLSRQHTDIAKICDENQYLLDYLTGFTGKSQDSAMKDDTASEMADTKALTQPNGNTGLNAMSGVTSLDSLISRLQDGAKQRKEQIEAKQKEAAAKATESKRDSSSVMQDDDDDDDDDQTAEEETGMVTDSVPSKAQTSKQSPAAKGKSASSSQAGGKSNSSVPQQRQQAKASPKTKPSSPILSSASKGQSQGQAKAKGKSGSKGAKNGASGKTGAVSASMDTTGDD